jgi:membrane protease YdiL (CAAX protease family)
MHRRHPALLFFVLACGYSWIGFFLFGLGRAGLLPFPVPGEVPLLFEYGPSLAAVYLVWRERGGAGVRALLARGLQWRVRLRWYLVVLLLTPATVLATLGLRALLGDPAPDWSLLLGWQPRFVDHMRMLGTPSLGPVAALVSFMTRGSTQTVLGAIVVAIISGGVTEEFGWRGYLQPKLRSRYGPVRTGVLVGILWGLWHLGPWQLLFTADLRTALAENGRHIFDYVLGGIPLAVLFLWVSEHTGGSVLLSILFHAAYNTTVSTVFGAWPDFPEYWWKAVLWATAALAMAFHLRAERARARAAARAEARPKGDRLVADLVA